MATISVDVPNASVPRVKAAWITYFDLDPAITNADLLAHIKAHFAKNIRDIVRTVEAEAARRQAEEAVNTEGVAS